MSEFEATAAPEDGELVLSADALLDVKLRVWAEIGRTRMPLADAVALPQGVLVDLDKEHDELIDLYVNGLHYARGRLVQVEGEWALTIDEITASPDSLGSLSTGA
jgi:flagellar motor switch protein FliN/FliY